MRPPSSRRGVSEIIAALLVVCITVSAATLFAVYASGLMGSLQMRVSQPYTEQLTLEYYNWLTVANGPSLTIRNDGMATITFAAFYIQGVKNTTDLTPNTCPSVLPVQSSCTLTFPVPSTLTVTSGIAYTVKFVAKDGTIFTFSIIAGSNTH
ncbi:MAG TPA: archaellin/type IV pilin N-terminal domain-containing protein [Candidatus Dormibacteraeota bacterium]|nr:archaellin/type IV pilin N-terminal domain-containing protein [Candidatus Dormibacteraeota bacterium]